MKLSPIQPFVAFAAAGLASAQQAESSSLITSLWHVSSTVFTEEQVRDMTAAFLDLNLTLAWNETDSPIPIPGVGATWFNSR